MWRTVLPKNANGFYTAVLYIEKVDALDAGKFTCVARDWGFVVNKSIDVSVKLLPVPNLTPLAATIWNGDNMIIYCLSSEDTFSRKYGYTWLKNGEILNPKRGGEIVEDIFPTGTRLLIRNARHTARYSCILSTTAGTTVKTSVITVLPTAKTS